MGLRVTFALVSTHTWAMLLYGEYNVKIDEKGRFLFPAGLQKKLPGVEDFVINRLATEGCLVIYPMNTWQEELEKLYAHNWGDANVRQYVRQFQNGATDISLDGSKRLHIPKHLLEFAGIDKDVVLSASFGRIECWARERYEAMNAAELPSASLDSTMKEVHKPKAE